MEQQALSADGCLETIISTYAGMVYRLAFARTGNRYDADEVFQEVFLRYVKKQPVFADGEHCKAWLIRVTINCAKKLGNSSWRRKTVPLAEETAGMEQEDINLYHELHRLPPHYREVIHLFYYEDMSIDTISRVLKRKHATIRTQLTRARAMLKNIIEEDNDVWNSL